jgi:hypothetical protein
VADPLLSRFRRCSGCGATCAVSDERCWLCLGMLHPLSERLDGETFSPTAAGDVSRAQFSLATLLLLTTLIAVCLGLIRLNPCLGTWAVILIVPAVIRTLYLGAGEKSRGHRLSVYEKVLAFIASLGVILLAYIAGSVALAASCVVTVTPVAVVPAAEPLILLAAIVSGGAGLAAAGWVVWSLRPRRR